MKIIKRVRYQRVKYKDLEHGAEYGHRFVDLIHMHGEKKGVNDLGHPQHPEYVVLALDTDKYPPFVTWDVSGVQRGEILLDHNGDRLIYVTEAMDDIETVYE